MIQISEGIWVAPEHVTVVKYVDLEKCSMWVTGQSALEGFLIPIPAMEAVSRIAYALEDDYDDDESDDDYEDDGEDE